MRGFRRLSLFLVILALTSSMLCGCYSTVRSVDEPDPGEEVSPVTDTYEDVVVETFPIPDDNRSPISPLWLEFLPACGSSGSYSVTANNVCYYDMAARRSSICCYQAGCKHNDTSCPAYFPNIYLFLAYGGKWYVLSRTEDETGFDFVCSDPATGERATLASLMPEKDTWHIDVPRFTIAYGKAYFHVSVLSGEDLSSTLAGSGESVISNRYVSLDLESGRIEEYEVDPSYEVLVISRDGVCLVKQSISRFATSEEELEARRAYEAEHPGESLWNFWLENTYYSLGTLELSSDRYEKLVDSEEDGYIISGDSGTMYGSCYIYQCGDTLWFYDVNERQSHKIVTMPDIINYWIMDRKAMFITRGEDGICQIWYADMLDGTPVLLRNGGRTDSMAFSVSDEGDDFFLGLYNGSKKRIYKQDFYNDHYENAF